MDDTKMMCGFLGTAVGACGAGLSVTEIQAIVSIIVTVLGFVISVLIPLIIKLVNKYKKAKEDGVITEEEAKDLAETGKDIVDSSTKFIEDMKDRGE